MARTEVFNREEVLDKAKNAFWLKGYNGTSMQDLVDATGLNRSSIYNSFGSKMELYQLALKKYQNESSALMDKATSQKKSAIETIGLLFLYAMKDMLRDIDNKGCMFINCNTEVGNQYRELGEILENNQERLIHFFEKLVIRGQAEGTINKKQESLVLAHYLVSAFQGFRITGMNTKKEKMLKGIIQNILRTIT